jgi:alkanesulfonate monooxygenase SsuD/methylene tetrahydromethanopterin reductase-like flavin-dependent oxidoreductase (luciferase family)
VIYDALTTPQVLADFAVGAVEVGLQRSGRTWADLDRGCVIVTAVNDDRSVALDLARNQVAYYMQFPSMDELVSQHGMEEEAEAVRNAAQRRDPDAMLSVITDRMVETFTLVGTPSEVRERLSAWTHHIDMPLLFSPTWRLTREQIMENHQAITAAFAADRAPAAA